jgi:outer membrane receptor protein involved in Fe transport
MFHGGIKVYEGATHPYDVTTGDWGGLKRTGNRSLAFNLSGPIMGMDPKRYTFFTAGEYLTDETSLPANGYDAYTWTAKVSAQPTSRIRLKSNFTYHDASGGAYTHRDVNGISYDFNLDGLPVFEKKSHLLGLTGNYHFNESMIFSATVNTFKTRTWQGPPDLIDTYWDQWPGYDEGTIDDDNYLGYRDYENPYHVVGFTLGDDFNPTFHRRESKYTSVKASLLTQLNKSNQVKAGIEYRRYNVAWDSKQFFNDNPYGEKYSSKPLMASAFLQDKLDNVTPRDAPLDTVARYVEAESKSRVSPRLGVSFPIAEASVMHFNYGVYYQQPRFTYLYTNIQGDVTSGLPLLGNPDLEPEQTISYELGLDHLIGEDIRIDLTAYYKDIKDLATTRASLRDAATTITYFDNGDYGSVTGFDVQLEKLPLGGYFGGSISYGYMIATGNGSSATEPYYTFLTSAEDTRFRPTPHRHGRAQLSCSRELGWRVVWLVAARRLGFNDRGALRLGTAVHADRSLRQPPG